MKETKKRKTQKKENIGCGNSNRGLEYGIKKKRKRKHYFDYEEEKKSE
jgi:hypothetical protein